MSDDAKKAIPDVSEHLRPVLAHLLASGARIGATGRVWSRNCRMWVYVDVGLDCESLQQRFALPACVVIHDHIGTHDGSERGLDCEEHHDAVMGIHPRFNPARVTG